jgi:SAM-dependent methyltransferase
VLFQPCKSLNRFIEIISVSGGIITMPTSDLPAINYIEPYTALANFYQTAGFSHYSAELAPRLLDLAFELEWTGRSLYDMACGTGDLANWFSEHGFRVLGVDHCAPMTRTASAYADSRGLSAEFVTSDIRTHEAASKVELVTCLGGSLNYIPTLRDLEAVFRQASSALMAGKLFIFDLFTIQGLSRSHDSANVVYDDGSNLTILQREFFSFESLLLNRIYTIWATDRGHLRRADESHILRGYPLAAINSTLAKAGFTLLRTLTPNLVTIDPQTTPTSASQLIFVGVKN